MIHTKKEWSDRLFNAAALLAFCTAVPFRYSLWVPAIIISVAAIGCAVAGSVLHRKDAKNK